VCECARARFSADGYVILRMCVAHKKHEHIHIYLPTYPTLPYTSIYLSIFTNIQALTQNSASQTYR